MHAHVSLDVSLDVSLGVSLSLGVGLDGVRVPRGHRLRRVNHDDRRKARRQLVERLQVGLQGYTKPKADAGC